MKVLAWVAYVSRLFWPYRRIWEDDDEFRDAVEWAKRYVPRQDASYGVVADYSEQMYRQYLEHIDSIDQKANELSKFAIIGGTLIASVSAVVRPQIAASPWAIWVFVAAIVGFVGAIALSIISTKPGDVSTPVTVRELLGIREDTRLANDGQVEALIAASRHCAMIGLRLICREKSWRYAWAAVLVLVALGSVAVGAVLMAATCIVRPAGA